MNQIVNPDPHAMRINRFLADAGFGSRRSVEDLIRQGRVSLDGETVQELGTRIHPGQAVVRVDGVIVAPLSTGFVFAFHKPLHVVCTLKGQGGQATLLPFKREADLPGPVMPVGRLDSDSTGLLLWTDDGIMNQRLCRPGSGIWKEYEVQLLRPLGEQDRSRFCGGSLLLDDRPCLPCRLSPLSRDRCRWTVYLHEGRKRQIRRMFQVVGNKVVKLHRVAFGPVRLGNLQEGCFQKLSGPETQALRRASSDGSPI